MGYPNPFVGTWKYRSFRNRPDAASKLEDILFWEAEIRITADTMESFVGEISDGTDKLLLNGSATYGYPYAMRFQGLGVPGTGSEGWIYNYIGFLVPAWPDGVSQRAAIVGSVIRTVPHSNGQAKAGYVASFIAVRLDSK